MTKIGSLNIEGRESRRYRKVNCDIERSVQHNVTGVVDVFIISIENSAFN